MIKVKDKHGVTHKIARVPDALAHMLRSQCPPSPEGRLAVAVISGAMSYARKPLYTMRTGIPYINVDCLNERDFLTKPNFMLDYWCSLSMIDPQAVIELAKMELSLYDITSKNKPLGKDEYMFSEYSCMDTVKKA